MKHKPNNPRRISPKEFERLRADLTTFGDLSGIVHNVTTGNLVGGNQRTRAMDLLSAGALDIVARYDPPTRAGTIAEGFFTWQGERYLYREVAWDAATEDAACIVANRDGGWWDFDALAAFDAELLEGLGFDADYKRDLDDAAAHIAAMLDALTADVAPVDAGAQVDRAAELQAKWQVQPGDVWECAGHFVICGDCRDPETWTRLLQAAGVEKVNGVFTSPPYAMQRKEQYGGVEADEYVEWWEAVQANVRANLAGDGSFFVNIKPHCEDGERVLYVFDLVLAMKRRWGWRFVDELCWKHQGIPGRWNERFKNQFEPVYHFSTEKTGINHGAVVKPFSDKSGVLSIYDGIDNRPAKTGSPFRQGGKKSAEFDGALPGNVIEYPIGDADAHAAAFPVALPTFFVKAYSDAGDVWLDPFCGSGTTIVAAHNEGRRGLGIEQLEKYVAVILERLATATGKTPVLER